MRTTWMAGAILLGAAGGVTNAAAQAVGQADVQIQSLTVNFTPTVAGRVKPIPRPISPVMPPSRFAPAAAAPAGGSLVAQVVVFSNNDDDAQNVKLNIFLPPETHVLALPPGCTAPVSNNGSTGVSNAFVHCTLGVMTVNASRSVTLTISRPPSFVVPRVGVFAWSDTPDPNTGNNHAEAVAP